MGEKPEGGHSSAQTHPPTPFPPTPLCLPLCGAQASQWPQGSARHAPTSPVTLPTLLLVLALSLPCPLLLCFSPQHFPPSDLPGIYIIDHLIFKAPPPTHTHPCNWNISSPRAGTFPVTVLTAGSPCLTGSGCSVTILERMDEQVSSLQPFAPGFQIPQLCKLESFSLPASDEIQGREPHWARHRGGEDGDAGL